MMANVVVITSFLIIFLQVKYTVPNQTSGFSYDYTEKIAEISVDEWFLISSKSSDVTEDLTINVTDIPITTTEFSEDYSTESTTSFNETLFSTLNDTSYEVISLTEDYARNVELTTKKPTWTSCFDEYNVSNVNYTFVHESLNDSMVVLEDENGTPCLQIKMHVLIQVKFLRSKELYEKWSASYFPAAIDDSMHVDGECDKNNEAHVKISWDKYTLIWRFAKILESSSWHLRTLEFFTAHSDWFTKYGFEDKRCRKFRFHSNHLLKSPLDQSYKACEERDLKLDTDEESLSVYVFLLKNKFQVQAFMKNDTFFDETAC